jgi:hypothetical protein
MSSDLYLINHLFLPPKLPQEDDSGDLDDEKALLLHISKSATAFLQMLERDGASQPVNQCWLVLQRMLRFMYGIHRRGQISAAELQRVICQMAPRGSFSVFSVAINTLILDMMSPDVLCFHISAQNAGIILRRFRTKTTLEFFQASPTAASVTGNTEKLIVQFPSSPRLSFPNDPEFISALCTLLVDLDCHVIPDAMPITRKAGSRQVESREVPDISYISELLRGIVAALTRNAGDVARETVYVTKRLNDHVLWANAELPWRRAPKWLIVRVALQTTLAEWGVNETYGYKVFITFVLSRMLEKARQSATIPHHLLFTMLSKTATRVGKFQSITDVPTSAFVYVTTQIKDTRSFLDHEWKDSQERAERPVPWAAPSVSEITKAQIFPLSRSGEYLSAVFNRGKMLQQETEGFSARDFEASLLRVDGRKLGLSPPSPIPGDTKHRNF